MSRTIRRIDTPQEFDPERVNHDTVFVVIDVMMFSSSVVTLLEKGVREVIPVRTDSDLQEYKDQEILCGGEYDSFVETEFSNSPQNIHGVFGQMETVPETVAMTSGNGAQRLLDCYDEVIEKDIDSEVIVGTTINASAIANWVNTNYPEHDVLIVTSGSDGSVAIEDVLGGLLISQEIYDQSPYTREYKEMLQMLPAGRLENPELFGWLSEEDVHHTSQLNSSSIVPQLQEDKRIRDVSEY